MILVFHLVSLGVRWDHSGGRGDLYIERNKEKSLNFLFKNHLVRKTETGVEALAGGVDSSLLKS